MELDNLSPRELLHFAINASNNGRADLAIQYLKKLVAEEPENPEALFLLGSEYAEINMFDEAISFMEKALKVSPDAHIIRFQLGMLLLTLNQNDDAKSCLTPLESIEDNHEIYHYGQALLAIIDEDIEKGQQFLQQGLSLPNSNPSLEANMQKLMEKISAGNVDNNQTEKTDSEADSQNTSNLFLSVYDS